MANINFRVYIEEIPFGTVREAVRANFQDWLRVNLDLVIFLALLFWGSTLLLGFLDWRWIALPVVIVLIPLIKRLTMQGQEVFFRSVAASWGWEYIPVQKYKEFPSSFLAHGKDASALRVLRSKTLPAVSIATLCYWLEGPNMDWQYTTVVRVDLAFRVAHLVLLNNETSSGSRLLTWCSDLEELDIAFLKGTGRQLYVEKKLEIEALQVFSEERTAKVVDGTGDFTVEFIDTDVYVYRDGQIQNRDDLRSLLEVGQLVLDELVPKLAQISSSTRAMQEAKQDKGI